MLLGFAAGVALVGALAAWRPALALAAMLLSLAVGLQWVLEDTLPREALRWLAPGHKALVGAALAGCALRYGLRPGIVNWPSLAIAWLVLQTFLLTGAEAGPARVVLAAFALAVPWLVPQVRFGATNRLAFVYVAALTPLLSIALGFVLQAAGLHAAHAVGRLQGATNAGWLGFLAYAGFAICLHEAVREPRRRFGALAVLNLAIAILTAGRMAVFACIVHGLAYIALSPAIARRLGRIGRAAAVTGAAIAAIAIFFLPILQARMSGPGGADINMSGRDQLALDYLQEFLASPLLGRGLGTASFAWNYFLLPHNEYVRLLVEGGLVGFVLFAAAVLAWARALGRRLEESGRAFAMALSLSLAIYALTDNVLIMPPGLMAFALLCIVLAESERTSAGAPSARFRTPEAAGGEARPGAPGV